MKSFKHAVGWAAVCCTLVASFEGLSTTAYPDKLAHGLPTVCYGETEGVSLTDKYTPQECADMLAAKLPRYYAEIAACIKVPVSDNEKAAYTSFAYNVGSQGFCRSGALKLLNSGNHKAACRALMAWDMASGRHIPGLARRRAAERDLCMTGLT